MASDEKTKWKTVNNYNNGGGAVYGLGVIGALFYYLSQANSFVTVVLGIIKALLWPAFVVFQLLSFLKM